MTKTGEIPDFKAMPFEELMTTEHKPDNDTFNQPLWEEQCERMKKLNIAPLDDFESVDKYQDEIAADLKKLEAKFTLFLQLIDKEKHSIAIPRPTLEQYLEDAIK